MIRQSKHLKFPIGRFVVPESIDFCPDPRRQSPTLIKIFKLFGKLLLVRIRKDETYLDYSL